MNATPGSLPRGFLWFLYLNFVDNMATFQFDHRLLAWILAIGVPLFWIATKRTYLPLRARTAADLLLLLLAIQIALGISTLLLVMPIPLAATHQGGAVLLFAAALWMRHNLRREA